MIMTKKEGEETAADEKAENSAKYWLIVTCKGEPIKYVMMAENESEWAILRDRYEKVELEDLESLYERYETKFTKDLVLTIQNCGTLKLKGACDRIVETGGGKKDDEEISVLNKRHMQESTEHKSVAVALKCSGKKTQSEVQDIYHQRWKTDVKKVEQGENLAMPFSIPQEPVKYGFKSSLKTVELW